VENLEWLEAMSLREENPASGQPAIGLEPEKSSLADRLEDQPSSDRSLLTLEASHFSCQEEMDE
jgi:hypothetical protein